MRIADGRGELSVGSAGQYAVGTCLACGWRASERVIRGDFRDDVVRRIKRRVVEHVETYHAKSDSARGGSNEG